MTTSTIAAAMMRDESRDPRRRVGRERGGDERFSQPDPVALGALASLNPKNRGRAETATARARRLYRLFTSLAYAPFRSNQGGTCPS
mmetsp:Transcript_8216/g.33704  ORF Transcript_8216/g.33704 Transcript_8216/m.33704 type:complete len:87 (+) Transcript_8216:475-735(+)